MRICYILAYRDPNYIRTRSLITAISKLSDHKLTCAINKNKGLLRYLETIKALFKAKNKFNPEIYILGFRGHEIAWLVRWITRRKILIFDALMSPYLSLRDERKAGFFGIALAPLYRPFEHYALKTADLILTDTSSNAELYKNEFDIPLKKILAIPVGAVESLPKRKKAIDDKEMTVLFYGSFLPLHGVHIIISAAALVKDLPIRFDFIGGSKRQAKKLQRLCAKYQITRWTHRRWLSLDALVEREIPSADLCLGGPFGGTNQARRVVTGKTCQCLALGRPTVIGSIDENLGFSDKYNCLLVPQNNAQELANALRWAYEHREALSIIGDNGRYLYLERFSVDVIAHKLRSAFEAFSSINQKGW